MSSLMVAPIVLPLLSAALCFIAYRSRIAQQVIGVVGALALLGVSIALMIAVWRDGPAAVAIGGWRAPLGIALVADTLSALMVLVTGVLGALVAIYALVDVSPSEHRSGGFFPAYHVLLGGACGAFLTADLFNLFVWFEVLLTASFVLLAMGRSRMQLEGALKYVAINLIGSAILLGAVALTYAATKSLNMADASIRLAWVNQDRPSLVLAIAALYGVAFGIKAALFPLFSWLPPSYPTPPAAVTAIFSGLLTKVGVYAFFRVFTLVLPSSDTVFWVLLVVSCFTMVLGVAGALAQQQIRRLLSFDIISQVGYMIVGVGLLVSPDPAVRELALAAGIFYAVHNIVTKSNLFLIAGVIERLGGANELDKLGGLARRAPLWAGLFLVSAFALAGIPPLSGFGAKLLIVWASFGAGQWWVGAICLLVALFTLITMIKIWNGAFWKPAAADQVFQELSPARTAAMAGPSIVLAAISIFIGLVPLPLFAVTERAASELLSPASYRQLQGIDREVVTKPEPREAP